MPRTWNLTCLAIVLLPATAVGQTTAVMPARIDATADGKVPAAVLDDAVLTAVQSSTPGSVVGKSDLEAVIGLEKQKDLAGCDDVACMAEIAGALDANRIVAVGVAWLDEEWTVTAKLIASKGTPSVDGRVTRFVKGGPSDLLKTIPDIIAELFDAAAGRARTGSAGSGGARVEFRSRDYSGAVQIAVISGDGSKGTCTTEAVNVSACVIDGAQPGNAKVSITGDDSLDQVIMLGPSDNRFMLEKHEFLSSWHPYMGVGLLAVGNLLFFWRWGNSDNLIIPNDGAEAGTGIALGAVGLGALIYGLATSGSLEIVSED